MSDYLIAILIGWFSAQSIKFFAATYRSRRLKFRWLWRSGGLPSSHSAIIAALATGVGLVDGFDSSTFTIALVLALVVIYDAIGVRRAAGINSQAILGLHKDKSKLPEGFKVVLGHRPIEMISGVVLGVTTALAVSYKGSYILIFLGVIAIEAFLSIKYYHKLPELLDSEAEKYAKQPKK